jgi:N-acetyl-alpha-D-muramate 1-phosphate uridylyltransferase
VSGAHERPRVAMILAAGRGERMRPLTDTTPKPLLRVHGRTLIERHVSALVRAGIGDIIINLAWLGSQIRDYLGDGSGFGARIRYSEESPQALETAGGIIRALPNLSPGPFAVVNGDVYSDFPFETLGIGPALEAQLVLVPNPPQHPDGDFGLQQGLATADGSPRFTFSGIAVYRLPFFDGRPDGVQRLKPLWVECMGRRRCGGQLFEGVWEDVGTPERLEALNR